MPLKGQVYLVGDFNDWNTEEFPMKKTSSGWELEMELAPGSYQYKFFSDGIWFDDSLAQHHVDNEYGTKNSVIIVI